MTEENNSYLDEFGPLDKDSGPASTPISKSKLLSVLSAHFIKVSKEAAEKKNKRV